MPFGPFSLTGNPGEPAAASVGPRSDSRIDATGRGELGAGEKRALEQQRRNRADEGLTPGEVAERNLRAITVDRAMKAPRFIRS
jgi:hypothetical protein